MNFLNYMVLKKYVSSQVKRKKKEKKDEKGGVEKLPLTGFHPLGR